MPEQRVYLPPVCNDLEDLYQSALLLIGNAPKLSEWTNGDENTNVNLGGKSVPSLRKLIQNINRVAGIASLTNIGGVIPDGITINIDDLGMIWVVTQALIQSGGGLNVDANGKLYVDFSQMPTDKFEALLKSLRLPIWLTANTNFYVDINNAAAADTLDEGRGLSPTKPFKNIQPCLNYITENYNLGNFNALVNVAPGNYYGYGNPIALPGYTTGTGEIFIKGTTNNAVDILCSPFRLDSTVVYNVYSMSIRGRDIGTGNAGLFQASAGNINLRNIILDFSNISAGAYQWLVGLYSNGTGTIRFYAYNDTEYPTGIKFKNTGSFAPGALLRAQGKSMIQFAADIDLANNLSAAAFCRVDNGGLISVTNSGYVNPGRQPRVNLNGHTFTGQKYQIGALSQIGCSYGADFFPGTAGTCSSLGIYGN